MTRLLTWLLSALAAGLALGLSKPDHTLPGKDITETFACWITQTHDQSCRDNDRKPGWP